MTKEIIRDLIIGSVVQFLLVLLWAVAIRPILPILHCMGAGPGRFLMLFLFAVDVGVLPVINVYRNRFALVFGSLFGTVLFFVLSVVVSIRYGLF